MGNFKESSMKKTLQLTPQFNDENLDVFPLLSGTSQGHVFSLLVFKIILEVLASAIRREKEMTGIQMGRKKENFSICRGYFYVENPKHSIKRKSKIVGCEKYIYFCILIKTLWKLKIQKSMQSRITNNKQTKKPMSIYKSYKNCRGPIIETY